MYVKFFTSLVYSHSQDLAKKFLTLLVIDIGDLTLLQWHFRSIYCIATTTWSTRFNALRDCSYLRQQINIHERAHRERRLWPTSAGTTAAGTH